MNPLSLSVLAVTTLTKFNKDFFASAHAASVGLQAENSEPAFSKSVGIYFIFLFPDSGLRFLFHAHIHFLNVLQFPPTF